MDRDATGRQHRHRSFNEVRSSTGSRASLTNGHGTTSSSASSPDSPRCADPGWAWNRSTWSDWAACLRGRSPHRFSLRATQSRSGQHRHLRLPRSAAHARRVAGNRHRPNTVGDLLAPLDALGPDKSATYVETLHTYLDERGSLQRAAARLHLHRNAVVYRMAQIKQGAGRRPEGPRPAVCLATRMSRSLDDGDVTWSLGSAHATVPVVRR